MRKTALTIAALFALTGAALAENPNAGAPASEKAPVALDMTKTGSVRDSGSTEAPKPRLGYDGNPWFVTDMR